jgi:hypothetical protein
VVSTYGTARDAQGEEYRFTLMDDEAAIFVCCSTFGIAALTLRSKVPRVACMCRSSAKFRMTGPSKSHFPTISFQSPFVNRSFLPLVLLSLYFM